MPEEGLRLGSEAQLRGELAQDFTAHCRESLILSLTDAVSRLDAHDENDDPSSLYKDTSWLLVSVDPEVLLLALEVRAASDWYKRRHGFSSSSKDLKQLSYGWPGNDEPLDLMTCIHGCATPEASRLASSLYFEFYDEDGKLQVIQVGMEELQSQDCLPLFNGLVREFQVPKDLRFALLTRIRFAKAFPSTADRHQYVKILLHALADGRFPQKQVRELAINPDIPESLRATAMYAWMLAGRSRDQELFSPEDRDAMIHAFLAGDVGCCSSDFIKALLYHSSMELRLQVEDRRHRRKLPLTADMFDLLSLDEVLAWLEDELDEEKSTVSHFEEHANLGQKQRIVQGLVMSRALHDCHDEMTKEQSLMRNQYLEKILDDANLLERSSDSDGAVHLSSNGWKIVEACMEHFAKFMQPDARSKMVGLILGGMPSIPKRVLKTAMGNDNGLLAIHLLQAGGYKFLDQLPSSAIDSWLRIEDPLDDTAYESMAKLAEELGRFASSSEEHLEKLVQFMYWMLRCNSVGQVLTGSLKALVTSGAVERLLEAVRRWCTCETSATSESLQHSLEECFWIIEIFVKHRRKWEQGLRDTDAISRIMGQFLDTVLYTLRNCDVLQWRAARIIRRLCPPAADIDMDEADETPDYEMADMASSTVKVAASAAENAIGIQISLPPLLEMTDLLLKLNRDNAVLTVWRRYNRGERQEAFALLLDRLESEDPDVAAAAASLVALFVAEDDAAADAVSDKVVATKLLELAFSKGLAEELVLVLDELFGQIDDGNPFAEWERSEDERKAALAWFASYVRRSDRCDKALLSLGERLTRSHKVAMEFACAGDFGALFQRLLELYRRWPSANFMSTVWHFLEDHDMLYNRMVKAMRDLLMARDGDHSSSACEVGEFLDNLSDLAYREPAVFMQASFDTCQVIHRAADNTHYIVLRDRDSHKGGGSVLTRHFRDVFAVMIDPALSDPEVLTEICRRLGHEAVDLVLAHRPGVLDDVVKDCCSYDAARFLEVVEKHNKAAVDEARARAYSRQDVEELLDWSACREVLDASAADRAVRVLCGLDLEHPKAVDVVRNFVNGLQRFSTGEQSSAIYRGSAELSDGLEVSEEGVTAFCAQHLLMAQNSVVSAASSIKSEQEATTATTLEDGNGGCSMSRQTTTTTTSQGDSSETGTDQNEADEEQDEQGVSRMWRIDNDELEKLVRLLWISKLDADPLCSLLENHADHTHLARTLVAMVLKPGELRALGSEGNGHWHRNPVAGVPGFVANRVLDILHRLADHHSFSVLACINEDDAVAFISLMLKNTVPMEKLLKVLQAPASFSHDNIWKLCSLYADTESIGDVLAVLIAVNPALSPVIYSTMVSTSSDLVSTTLEKLEAGDHTSNTAVLRFVRAFDQLVSKDDIAAREQLKLALDPLWIHAAHDHRSSRPLLQALFLAQTFSSEPADSAVRLANELLSKNTDRNLDLVLPLLWKWPALFTVDVDAKLKLLRSKFGRESYRSLSLRVERDNILKHSYEQFAKYSVKEFQRSKVSVKFEDDAVRHLWDACKVEWFQLLSQALKDKDALLFSALGDCYRPNPLSGTRPDHLSYFKFVGRVVAEAIIEDVKLDIHFTDSFLKHILGQPVPCSDIKPQMDAFLEGFYQLVPKDAIRIFNELELAFLISGSREIDVAELKQKAETGDDCDVLRWFWDIVQGFDNEDKARLLKFITGSAKIPHAGIGVFLDDDAADINLPTASVCYHSINLPRYKSRGQLEQKLLLAIREGCEGFHLKED